MVALAIRTGIAPSVWAAEGDRAVFTAFALLRDQGSDDTDETDAPDDPDAPQMSG